MRRAAVALGLGVIATGCASSYQSAHVLPPGKTQLTAALTRAQGSQGGTDQHEYFGDLQLRHGIDPKLDGGLRLIRTPGVGGAGAQSMSMFMMDGKYQLSAPHAPTTLAFALPVGVMISDTGTSFDNRGIVVAPTMFVGFPVGRRAELVFAPKLVLLYPDGGSSQTDLAASLGLRFDDLSHAWGLQPEVSIFVPDGSPTIYSFGIAVTAGD